jgi:hypothetical protein
MLARDLARFLDRIPTIGRSVALADAESAVTTDRA